MKRRRLMQAQPRQRRGLVLGVALGVLLTAGTVHRWLALRIETALGKVAAPKVPLSELPLRIETWEGRDEPLDERIRRIAADDDFVNRTYVNQVTGRTVSLYVGYIGRPRSRAGHRPDVCYPAHGYKELSRERWAARDERGRAVPALLFEFASVESHAPPELVLANYLINGRFVNDTAAANAYNARNPGLFSRQLAYVTRIQVAVQASGDRSADVALLSDFASRVFSVIERMMPEPAG